jgi:hypothetical protein
MPRTRPLHGVFLGSHAIAEGAVTARQLKARLYRRLLHNVYADPGLVVDHQLYARAAALVMPPDAVLGGRSAAAWFGAPFAPALDPVVVLVPPESTWRGPKGVHVHRTTVPPSDVTTVEDDIRVTTPQRTAWEIATLETVPNAVALLDGLVRAGHLTEEQLRAMAIEGKGRWRASRAMVVMPLVDGRSQSPPESWTRVACVRAGLPVPVPQYVVIEGGEFLGKVDLAWPEARLIVEYEGPHHFDEAKRREDDERYRRLAAAGWTIIRLTTADLRDMEGIVRRVAEALGVTAGR